MPLINSFSGALVRGQLSVIWSLTIAGNITLTYYYLDVYNNVINVPSIEPYSTITLSSLAEGSYTFSVHENQYIKVKLSTMSESGVPVYSILESFNPVDSDSDSDSEDIEKVYKKTKKIYRKTKKILSILENPK